MNMKHIMPQSMISLSFVLVLRRVVMTILYSTRTDTSGEMLAVT